MLKIWPQWRCFLHGFGCFPWFWPPRELLKHGHEVGTLADALNCISKEGSGRSRGTCGLADVGKNEMKHHLKGIIRNISFLLHYHIWIWKERETEREREDVLFRLFKFQRWQYCSSTHCVSLSISCEKKNLPRHRKNRSKPSFDDRIYIIAVHVQFEFTQTLSWDTVSKKYAPEIHSWIGLGIQFVQSSSKVQPGATCHAKVGCDDGRLVVGGEPRSYWSLGQKIMSNEYIIGLVMGTFYRQPLILPSKIGVSCQISHQSILGI